MDLSAIKSHIVDAAPAGVRKVGGAAALAAIKAGRVPTPAIYLLPLSEPAGAMEFSGTTLQRVSPRFGVVLAVSNKSDAEGEAALDDLEPLRKAVKTLLHGWAPTETHERICYVTGNLLALDDGVVYWIDEYVSSYYEG